MALAVLAAAKGEAPVMTSDDTGGDPEPEAGSVDILGGVEGLEEAGLHGRCHAVTSVGDGDTNAAARLGGVGRVVCRVVGADKEAASLAHGVDRVGDEVIENLANVVLKAEDSAGRRIGRLNLDVGVSEPALIEVKNSVNEVRSADVCGANCLAMKAKSLGGDLADA